MKLLYKFSNLFPNDKKLHFLMSFFIICFLHIIFECVCKDNIYSLIAALFITFFIGAAKEFYDEKYGKYKAELNDMIFNILGMIAYVGLIYLKSL